MQHEDKGLAHDLSLLLAHDRRAVLKWISAGVVIPLLGCSDDDKKDSAGTDDSVGTDDSAAKDDSGVTDDSTVLDDSGVTDDSAVIDDSAPQTCEAVPEETPGPYPGDGSNGPDALEISGIVRSDIRTSIGSGVGTAEGLELTLTFTVVDAKCRPLEGYAVYAWQCDRDGLYSMYTAPKATYLRGVQITDAKGRVTFTTIFPGCYVTRWPHIHFEVFPSLKSIADATKAIATSQIAFARETCEGAYTASGYESSAEHLAALSIETDNVFRDDLAVDQIPTISGSVSKGYVAEFTIGV
jgi:protocatechuate 3,4-dioxygenase beta subunit